MNIFSSFLVDRLPYLNYAQDSIVEYKLNSALYYTYLKEFKYDISNNNNLKRYFLGTYTIRDDYDLNALLENVKCDDNQRVFVIAKTDKDLLNELNIDDFEELNSSSHPINPYMNNATHKITRVFINEKNKKIVVFLQGNITLKWIDKFISCFPKIFRWVYQDNTTEDDIEVFKKFAEERQIEVIIPFIEKIIPQDIEEKYWLKEIKGFENFAINNKIERLKISLEKTTKSITDYYQKLNNYIIQKREDNEELNRLNAILNSNNNESEVSNFFSTHKQIKIKSIYKGDSYTSPTIRFSIIESLEYYDVDEFLKIYHTEGSILHVLSDDMKKVLYEIFVNEKGKFIVQSEFDFINMVEIEPRNHSTYVNHNNDNTLPHPHLGFYRCLGGNSTNILKYLEKGQWDMALEQCIAATKNINFSDYTVLRRTIEYLRLNRDGQKFILADNGERMNINTFFKYISEENKNE